MKKEFTFVIALICSMNISAQNDIQVIGYPKLDNGGSTSNVFVGINGTYDGYTVCGGTYTSGFTDFSCPSIYIYDYDNNLIGQTYTKDQREFYIFNYISQKETVSNRQFVFVVSDGYDTRHLCIAENLTTAEYFLYDVDNIKSYEIDVQSPNSFIVRQMSQNKVQLVAIGKNTQNVYEVSLSDGNVYNNTDAIDMGLSVRWGSKNLGASTPFDYGEYYAWGETEVKDYYAESNYKYYENGSYVDIGPDIAGTDKDAAQVKMGGGWRMPTNNELSELANICSWELISRYGKNVYKVTGPTGNVIYIPLSGSKQNTMTWRQDEISFLWSSNSYQYDNSQAVFLRNNETYMIIDRCFGLSIRPVFDESLTAIDKVYSSQKSDSTKYYSMDGRNVDEDHKGITIVKKSDGSVIKQMLSR